MIYLYLFLIIIVLLGLVILLQQKIKDLENKVGKVSEKKEEKSAGSLSEFNQKRLEEKEKRKVKIVELLKERGKITNEDVEKMFGVSDATATNYLQELEDEGKIRQVGKSGPIVYYE